jgi:chorismate mutase
MSLLAQLRSEIDAVDARIVALLAERRRLVEKLAGEKAEAALGPVDAARETELVRRWAAHAAREGLPDRAAIGVLDAILAESRGHVADAIERARASRG